MSTPETPAAAKKETIADIDELVQQALQKALAALEYSAPIMGHYPEPKSRHAQAIEAVKLAIRESSK